MTEETGAAYVFRLTVRLDPDGVRASPDEFETVFEYPAPPPGEDGWLFFRDHLWRGEVNDDRWLREAGNEWLGLEVVSGSFRELRTSEAYLDALKAAIAADLARFNADDVAEALHKYLGSSIHVRTP